MPERSKVVVCEEYEVVELTGMRCSEVEDVLNELAAGGGWRVLTTAQWCTDTYSGVMTSAVIMVRSTGVGVP